MHLFRSLLNVPLAERLPFGWCCMPLENVILSVMRILKRESNAYLLALEIAPSFRLFPASSAPGVLQGK